MCLCVCSALFHLNRLKPSDTLKDSQNGRLSFYTQTGIVSQPCWKITFPRCCQECSLTDPPSVSVKTGCLFPNSHNLKTLYLIFVHVVRNHFKDIWLFLRQHEVVGHGLKNLIRVTLQPVYKKRFGLQKRRLYWEKTSAFAWSTSCAKDDGTFREKVIKITYVWCLLHFRCCFYNLLLPYDDLRPCVHLKGFAGCPLICIWQLVISGHCRLLFSCIFPIHHTSVNILLFIGRSCQKLET